MPRPVSGSSRALYSLLVRPVSGAVGSLVKSERVHRDFSADKDERPELTTMYMLVMILTSILKYKFLHFFVALPSG